jgi:hypothetical protein
MNQYISSNLLRGRSAVTSVRGQGLFIRQRKSRGRGPIRADRRARKRTSTVHLEHLPGASTYTLRRECRVRSFAHAYDGAVQVTTQPRPSPDRVRYEL